MLADSYILPECIVKPGSFGGLMALYEANFIKLSQLIEGLEQRSDRDLSMIPDDCKLYFAIENRTRYTCELRLTYLFEQQGRAGGGISAAQVADPDLVARVYFDARMAEVTGWINSHRHELLRSLSRRYQQELDLCWRRNIMLSKWLDYLLERGHRFPTVDSISP